MTKTLLPTTVVGSYPQPDWLIDRDRLTHLPPVRVRAQDLWRIPEPWLEQAQDDATRLAIRDMEEAGIDIITDGEIRRESYSNRFATALSGVDLDNPATVRGRSSGTVVVPRIVGPIRRLRPVEVHDAAFLRRHTDRTTKITIPGPFTMSRQAENEFYRDEEELVMDYAAAVNAELHDLKAAGVDVIQLDEPWMQARPEEARRLAVRAINRALDGISGATALHLCFGYAYVSRDKPNRYSFLSELTGTVAGQISIEAAQPGLDLRRPRRSRRQDRDLRRDQHGRPRAGNTRDRGRPHPRRARACAARAAGPGPRLRHEIPAARYRFRQAQGLGRRGGHRPPRADREVGLLPICGPYARAARFSVDRPPILEQTINMVGLAELRERVRRIERPASVQHGVVPFGIAAIDRVLPGGGLARGALHEIVGSGGDEEDGALAAAFAAGIVGRLAATADGIVPWCLKRPDLYGPGLAAQGLDPGRLVLVRAAHDTEILWAMEEGLRAAGVTAAVVGEIAALPMVASRRLQLAAERSGVTALIVRRWRDAAQAARERSRPSAAATRWRIAAMPSAPTGGEPGIGHPRWRVELMRCRGGEPACWEVEAADATGSLSVAAELADRPPPPRRDDGFPLRRGDGFPPEKLRRAG